MIKSAIKIFGVLLVTLQIGCSDEVPPLTLEDAFSVIIGPVDESPEGIRSTQLVINCTIAEINAKWGEERRKKFELALSEHASKVVKLTMQALDSGNFLEAAENYPEYSPSLLKERKNLASVIEACEEQHDGRVQF